MKQGISKIEHHIRRLWAWVKKGTDHYLETGGEEETVEPHQFGDAGWQCPKCSKWMHEGVKEDHQKSHEEDKSEDISENRSALHETENKVSISDYVDDYEIDWIEEEEEEIEIQEVNDNRGLKKEKLRKRWQPVIDELKRSGEVTFEREDHYRAWRGKNIAQEFRKAVKRIDLEMELEFDVGRKKSTIRRRERSKELA